MPSKRVFLDTNGWLALLNSGDALHSAASDLWRQLIQQRASFVLTDWIVAETGNGLARTPARSQFVRAVDLLQDNPRIDIVAVTDSLQKQALELYGERSDKTWGLVDCASFLVMQTLGLREAFTNDHHFHQAGYSTLLPLP